MSRCSLPVLELIVYFLPFSHCYRCEMYKYGLVGVDVGAGYVLCISMGVFSVQRSAKFFCSFVTPLCRIHVSFYVDKVSFILHRERCNRAAASLTSVQLETGHTAHHTCQLCNTRIWKYKCKVCVYTQVAKLFSFFVTRGKMAYEARKAVMFLFCIDYICSYWSLLMTLDLM